MATVLKPRRPATEEEVAKIRRIWMCNFLPGSWDKRFARDLAGAVMAAGEAGEIFMITEGQAEQVERLYHRYRRQITGKK